MKFNGLRGMMIAAVMLLAAGVVVAADAPPAKTLDVALQEQLQPVVREWVAAEAQKLARTPNAPEAAVRADIQKRFQGQALAAADEERLAYLIVFEATQLTDHEVKQYMAQIKAGAATPPQPAVARPAAGSGLQVSQTGLPSHGSPQNGNVMFQPGPAANGASSMGIAGVSVAGSPAPTASSPPGGLTVTPVQAAQLQILTNARNQLARLCNSLSRTVPATLETQIQDLK